MTTSSHQTLAHLRADCFCLSTPFYSLLIKFCSVLLAFKDWISDLEGNDTFEVDKQKVLKGVKYGLIIKWS